jgi:Mrp family chromosome partitioning ATPase
MMAITQKPAVPLSPAAPGAAPSRDLVTTPGCTGAIVAAYHTLLTNVDLALGPHAGGMVAIAALDANADAARVGANLSLVAAQSGDRTLLVDCDLQGGALTHLFGLDPAPGLAQLLGGEHSDLRALTQPTALPTLGVIVAGASGTRYGRLARLGDLSAALLRLKNAADRVMLVAPPVLASTDLLQLAAYVDGVLLVVAPGRTQREMAARARTILNKAEVPLLGVALVPS